MRPLEGNLLALQFLLQNPEFSWHCWQCSGETGLDGLDGPVPALVSVQGGAQRVPQQEDGQISSLQPGDVDWADLWQSEQFWSMEVQEIR